MDKKRAGGEEERRGQQEACSPAIIDEDVIVGALIGVSVADAEGGEQVDVAVSIEVTCHHAVPLVVLGTTVAACEERARVCRQRAGVEDVDVGERLQ